MNNDKNLQLYKAFKKLLSEYASVYSYVQVNNNWKNPFREIISKEIPDLLRESLGIVAPYKTEGSYGKGRWTAVPWIAVFDTRITSSAQKGVYIAYLLNKDTKELYLTFEIAATEVMNQKINSEGKAVFTGVVGKHSLELKEKLQERAEQIRQTIKDTYFSHDGKINSGSSGYDSGTVYYKKYSLDTLPSGDEMVQDLDRMMDIYKKYYEYISTESEDEELIEEREEGDVKVPVSTKEVINKIKAYISAKGFSYEGSLIENLYLSLKSKPFVILAGTSGTGKTKLAEYFAEAVGGKKKLVPVRPDWSDSSDLFGHVNLKGQFVEGAVIGFIKEAADHKDKPYFLIFDEMNLARVEYYMSDFLSVLETRRRNGDYIITEPLFDDSIFGSDTAAKKKYSGLVIPDNLYIIGTVNMDETTFPFSKKVLDRANTIEFSYVDLNPAFEETEADETPLSMQNGFLRPEFLLMKECSEYKDVVIKTCDELIRINDKLRMADLHIGYRVRDDFCFYMINREKADVLSFNEAFDNQIMQKILPRIQGSSSSVKQVIEELFRLCAGDCSGYNGNSENEKMKSYTENHRDNCAYIRSAEKLTYMMRRYEEDGFTSYWL